MENITKTVTLVLTPDDIDTIVETLLEQVDIYNPWDRDFLRNLRQDIHVYCDNDYTTSTFLDDPTTASKLIKAVATCIGKRYKEAIDEAVEVLE